MSRSHEGKVAAIFGASFGMGRASAVALAQRGATIAASGRTSEALDDVVSEIRAAGGAAEAFPADVENPQQARSAVAEIADRLAASIFSSMRPGPTFRAAPRAFCPGTTGT